MVSVLNSCVSVSCSVCCGVSVFYSSDSMLYYVVLVNSRSGLCSGLNEVLVVVFMLIIVYIDRISVVLVMVV